MEKLFSKLFPRWNEYSDVIKAAIIAALIAGIFSVAVALITGIFAIIGAFIQKAAAPTPLPTLTSTATATPISQTPTPGLTQTPSPSPTITVTGAPHTVRFVVTSIPTDKVHTLYYSVDGGEPIRWATLGSSFDAQRTDIHFFTSIHVWIDLDPGTFLSQQLIVDGKKVQAKTNNAGLLYSVKDKP